MSNNTVKIDPAKMFLIHNRLDLALRETIDALKTDIVQMQVTPKETGNLEGSATAEKTKTGYDLRYTTPYAEKLYTHPEFNFRTDKNPNAKGRWLEDWISGEERAWLERTFAEMARRELERNNDD